MITPKRSTSMTEKAPRFSSYSRFSLDLKHHGLEYAAEHAAALGFDSVEFLGLSPAADDPARVREILRRNGLTVSCYSVAATLRDTPKRTKAEAMEILRRSAELAAEIGSPYLHHTVVSSIAVDRGAPPFEGILEELLDAAEEIARYAESLGLTVLYEPQGMYVNGDGLDRFFGEMQKRCKSVGICGDVGNSLFVDHAPEQVFLRFSREIRHVHLKDYAVFRSPKEDETCYETRGGLYLAERELGRGEVQLAKCIASLKAAGYTGAYSLETLGDDESTKRELAYARSLLG